jgi:hypothetical protein
LVWPDLTDRSQANSSEPAGAGRHGTFWAFWFFCTKSIGGVMTLSSGLLLQASGAIPSSPSHLPLPLTMARLLLLQASGFVPNQPVQAQSTRLVLVGFMVA